MKLHDNVRLEVISSKGLFKKMGLVSSLSDTQKLAMYNEDTTNGFPVAIAQKSRDMRNRNFRLSLLNGVLRFGEDTPDGYPFSKSQGVSPYAGSGVSAALGRIITVMQQAFAASYGTFNTAGDYAATVGAAKKALAARAAAIRNAVRTEFGVECEIAVGFSVNKNTGSTVTIPGPTGTAWGDLPAGVKYWDDTFFSTQAGQYCLATVTGFNVYWQSAEFSGNNFATYVSFSTVSIFVKFGGGYLVPLMATSPIQTAMHGKNGATANLIPIGQVSAFNYRREYVTDVGPSITFAYPAGTATTVSNPIKSYNGYVAAGLLMGAPTPVDEFILDRCTLHEPTFGVATITTETEDLRFTVSGEVMAAVLEADAAQAAEMATRRYGMWMTNRPRQLPADPYTLLPYWADIPEADKQEIRTKVLVDREGVTLTVNDAVNRAKGKKLTKMAFLLGEIENAEKESVFIAADGTPTFSTDADAWFGAYQQGSEYFTFARAEGAPFATPAAFVASYFEIEILAGSLPVTDPTNLESSLYDGGGMDPAYHPGDRFFQGLLATHVVERTDLVNSLQAFFANGMVARERYLG